MLKIAVAGDMHFPGRNGLEASVLKVRDEFYQSFIHHFMNQDADLYVSVGDLVEGGTKTEFDEIQQLIGQYHKPFYHVFGNHDLLYFPRNELNHYFDGRHGDQVIEKDDAIIVFLETAREMNKEDFGGWVTKQQLNWLNDVINSSGEKPMLVFAHHPVHDTTKKSEKEMFHIHPEADIWEILKRKKGTGIYINGHNHCDSIVRRENWHFVQLCCILDSQVVRMFELNDRVCTYVTLNLADLTLEKQAKILLDQVPALNANPNGSGTTLERNAKFIIR